MNVRLVALAAVIPFLAGCTFAAAQAPAPIPAPTEHVVTLKPEPTPTAVGLSCAKVPQFQRFDVSVLVEQYHGGHHWHGEAAYAMVDAGNGYRVIATRMPKGKATTWLYWDDAGGHVHYGEIHPETWDGGPTLNGVEAMELALRCVT